MKRANLATARLSRAAVDHRQARATRPSPVKLPAVVFEAGALASTSLLDRGRARVPIAVVPSRRQQRRRDRLKILVQHLSTIVPAGLSRAAGPARVGVAVQADDEPVLLGRAARGWGCPVVAGIAIPRAAAPGPVPVAAVQNRLPRPRSPKPNYAARITHSTPIATIKTDVLAQL